MKILGFLQSPNPKVIGLEYHIKYRDDYDFHRRVLESTMSGKRIRQSLGDLFDKIYWDNANPIPGEAVPNYEHIERVITKIHPDLIIAYGNIPRDALIETDPPVPMFFCHHPNARYKNQKDLDRFADTVRLWIQTRLQSSLDHQGRVKLLDFLR